MSIDADLITGISSLCHWCEQVFPESEVKYVPDDLPDDCYQFSNRCFSTCPNCYKEIVYERRSDLALKHGGDNG